MNRAWIVFAWILLLKNRRVFILLQWWLRVLYCSFIGYLHCKIVTLMLYSFWIRAMVIWPKQILHRWSEKFLCFCFVKYIVPTCMVHSAGWRIVLIGKLRRLKVESLNVGKVESLNVGNPVWGTLFWLMCSFFCPVDCFSSPILVWRRVLDKKYAIWICTVQFRSCERTFRNHIYHMANLCLARTWIRSIGVCYAYFTICLVVHFMELGCRDSLSDTYLFIPMFLVLFNSLGSWYFCKLKCSKTCDLSLAGILNPGNKCSASF